MPNDIFMTKAIVLVPAIIFLVTTGCQGNNKTNSATEKQQNTIAAGQKPVPRDFSVNKANAYNDIFLDSNDVEHFIVSEKLDQALTSDMRDFYNSRNYEFAWFSSNGIIEQAVSFHSLFSSENDSDLFSRSLDRRMDKVRADGDTSIDAKYIGTIKTELQITRRFIEYSRENHKGIDIEATIPGTYIPAKKIAVADLSDSVLLSNKYKSYAKLNRAYGLLAGQLLIYSNIVKKGGWQSISESSTKYAVGSSAPSIPLIKKRLQITRELAVGDSSDLFTPALEQAVKSYQISHGFKSTGLITADLIKDLNIPAIGRVQQILINMQRMRWMPTRPEGKLIIVNIPEFEVYVDSGTTNLFHMDAVVGAEGHNTSMFSGRINQIVFSPYWNIPPSIVKKEVLPGIKRSKNYLTKHNMEVTGHEGGLPVVRQRPGAKNALGKVKFLFPNSFNIYLHDSPEKKFFDRSERGLSHGCVRLSDAPKLAHYLLQNSQTWTSEKIENAMNSGVQQFVKLTPSVPVIITYYTTWIDDKGILHFADDIYGHDKTMALKMFTDPGIR
jgi:murein L,D-transpeptidase YcbB/YkuD